MDAIGNSGIQIQTQDMYGLMKDQLFSFILDLLSTIQQQLVQKHDFLAQKIKNFMDRTFGPAWNCIVGKGFASAVTYKNRHFIFFYVANKGILIFKYE